MFRFPRFTDYGKTTSRLQRRAEMFSCWDYCACGEIQESEAHCQAIWRHTKIGKLTLHTVISESIFSLLIFIHVVCYWQGEFVSQSKPLWLAIISLILMILMNVSEALYTVEIGKWQFWDRTKPRIKRDFWVKPGPLFSSLVLHCPGNYCLYNYYWDKRENLSQFVLKNYDILTCQSSTYPLSPL